MFGKAKQKAAVRLSALSSQRRHLSLRPESACVALVKEAKAAALAKAAELDEQYKLSEKAAEAKADAKQKAKEFDEKCVHAPRCSVLSMECSVLCVWRSDGIRVGAGTGSARRGMRPRPRPSPKKPSSSRGRRPRPASAMPRSFLRSSTQCAKTMIRLSMPALSFLRGVVVAQKGRKRVVFEQFHGWLSSSPTSPPTSPTSTCSVASTSTW